MGALCFIRTIVDLFRLCRSFRLQAAAWIFNERFLKEQCCAAGLPLASSAPTLVDGETSLTPSGTLPQTPARRSSSGVTGRSAPSASAGAVPSARKSGPSFGPTKIDLGDIETPSSSERSEADVDESKLVAGGDGMLTKALQAEDVEEGGAGEAGKVASGVANGSSALPISRMLANAPRGSMVRSCLS